MRTGSALVKKNKRKVSKGRPWLVFTEVRVVNSTYWLCMIQRVLMKPFLDHLNCNRDKLGWVTKQQWAMSLKGQTDTYWFSHIIYLILLSEQADGHSRPSRPICPSSALWRLLPLSTQDAGERLTRILTSGQKFFGNFSFSTVVMPFREATCLLCPDTAL